MPLTDAFCLRLALAMIYRAGLDALDDASSEACEAREFLQSDFARLAKRVILSSESKEIDFGDVSDYLGHYQRVKNQRRMHGLASETERNQALKHNDG